MTDRTRTISIFVKDRWIVRPATAEEIVLMDAPSTPLHPQGHSYTGKRVRLGGIDDEPREPSHIGW